MISISFHTDQNDSIFILQTGSHPHLVSLLGTTTDGGPTCLLLEYMPHGCLDEFLLSLREGPTPDWYLNFLRETLRGAYHKHVSGDLMNVLVQVADGMVSSIDTYYMEPLCSNLIKGIFSIILTLPVLKQRCLFFNQDTILLLIVLNLLCTEFFDGAWVHSSRPLHKKHPHW